MTRKGLRVRERLVKCREHHISMDLIRRISRGLDIERLA
jgi:hypothetical protein